jgi:hypothetical protein
MRVDTTVVETSALSRRIKKLAGRRRAGSDHTMKRIDFKIAGEMGAKLCDRGRGVTAGPGSPRRRAPEPSRAAKAQSSLWRYSMRPARWLDRRSGSPKLSEERSARGAFCNWLEGHAKGSTPWCR